ncbi:MAG: cupin domain-containing protein [Acidimicrobiales bacterium]
MANHNEETATGASDPVLLDQVATQELRESRVEIYDRPIGVRLLYRNPVTGAEHYLIRYPAGLQAARHRHTAAHTFVVLEGTLEANGERFGPGSYCHFPAGTVMHHAPSGDADCLFVAIFDGPQDVEAVTSEWSER